MCNKHSTYPPNYPVCGINEFLNYKSSCKIFQAPENNPTFILIKNQTYYSVNSSTINFFFLQYLSSQYQKSGNEESKLDAFEGVTTFQLDTPSFRNVTKQILKKTYGTDW